MATPHFTNIQLEVGNYGKAENPSAASTHTSVARFSPISNLTSIYCVRQGWMGRRASYTDGFRQFSQRNVNLFVNIPLC